MGKTRAESPSASAMRDEPTGAVKNFMGFEKSEMPEKIEQAWVGALFAKTLIGQIEFAHRTR